MGMNKVLQSGEVTPNNLAIWTTDGVIEDSGHVLSASSPALSATSLVRNDIPTVVIEVTTFIVAGNLTAGDPGAGAIYTSVGASPTGPMAIQDANGVWFNLVLENIASVGWFEPAGNGTTDDTIAIQEAFNATAARKVPLLVAGNFVYAIDSVTLPSDLSVWGETGSTFKLKDSAVGSLFKWASGATTTNVVIDGVILDGNMAGQPGAPHNLIHSLFYSDGTSTVTFSRFQNIIAHDIDGECFSFQSVFEDCIFDNIRVTNHSQDAFAVFPTRCHFSRIDIFNATNTVVRNTCNGLSLSIAIDCTFDNMTVRLSTTDTGNDKVGILLNDGSDNNVISGWDVDCGGGAHNFAYSIDTGSNNKFTNLIARNGIYNCDYEIFNQIGFQAVNLSSVNPGPACVGIIADGCNQTTISNYVYTGTSQGTDAVRVTQVGTPVFGPCHDFEINGYSITGAAEGFRFGSAACTNLRFFNGCMTNLSNSFGNSGIFMEGVAQVVGLIIDGLIIDGVEIPWTFDNLADAQISNVMVLSSVSPYVQNVNCTDVNYVNVVGANAPIGIAINSNPITGGTITANTGANSAAVISQGDAGYNIVSLNGTFSSFGNLLGIEAGKTGDNNVYFVTPSLTGKFEFWFTGAALSGAANSSGFEVGTSGQFLFSSSGGADGTPDTGISRIAPVSSVSTVAFGNGTSGNASATIKAKTKAGAPSTSDVPDGTWVLIRDTSNSTTKLYYNNGGSLQSVALV